MPQAQTFSGFDRVARLYRWLEYATFGRKLERIRFVHLPQLVNAQRILILGEGDGRFLEQLLRVNTQAQVVVVDKSPKMLRLAQERVDGSSRVEFVERDVAAYVSDDAAPKFDALVALFFLDCMGEPELERLIPELSKKLTPDGAWFVSDFHLPPAGLFKLLARAWIRFLYVFFGFFTDIRANELVTPDPMFLAAGFRSKRDVRQLGGLLRATEFQRAKSEA